MGRLRLRSLATAVALLAPASSAQAVTNGQPDDGRHPAVGAVVSHNGKDRKKHLICSGTLVSPTAFLTAAHCLVGEPSSLYVSFDAFVGAPDVGPEVVLHPGTGMGHPEYVDSTAPGDTHDVAVIKLDPPVQGITPAELPPPGALDDMERHRTLGGAGYAVVGYGREGKSGNGFFGGGGRRYGVGAFGSLEPFKLVTDQRSPLGGSCNGDSGGPVMLDGTQVIVGIISDGDPDCALNGINYRVDTDVARDFLDDHVAVPPPGKAPAPAPRTQPAPAESPLEPAPAAVQGGGFEPAAPAPAVSGRFARTRRGARVRVLRVSGLPAGARVELRCGGTRRARAACPFRIRRYAGRAEVVLTPAFRTRRLRIGTVVDLRVIAPGAPVRTTRWTVRRSRVTRTVR